ncbi:MAG: BT4734/BF3469 family protein [Salinivirgaceae bacterium]
MEIPKVSFFKCPIKNVWPEKEVNLKYVYNLIRREHYEQQTLKLRYITDSKCARNYKGQNFDYVTFSGTFSKRSDEYLIKHSGLLTIDFDHIPNLNKLKKILLVDEYFETVLLFKSPSGDGLKWIIPIDLKQGSHKDYFLAIANYIRLTYNVEVDASGKDISRACFLPHDREAYINPKYL